MGIISSGRLRRVAITELAAGAASAVQREAASIGPAAEAGRVIWTARLRTGRGVILPASGSKAFRAGALIVAVVEADLVVIASVMAEDLGEAVIALVAAGDLEAVALDALAVAVAGSGADAEN